MSATTWLAFLVAAGIGAPTRHLVDGLVRDRVDGAFPWATFVVNVTGSFLLGALTGLVLFHDVDRHVAVVLGAGFCGTYTTFSTFAFETARLVEERAYAHAVRNVLVTVVVGAAAAGVGLALAGL
jgi:CrcB protein